jgi:hypothetical protein
MRRLVVRHLDVLCPNPQCTHQVVLLTAMAIQRPLIATATLRIAMATMAVTGAFIVLVFMQAIEPPDALRSIVPAGTESP